MAFRKKLKKYTLMGMVATVFFIVFFIIPVESVTEDRGGGRTVEMQKTLIQVLLQPKVDIEIDVGGEPTFCIEIFAPVCGNDGVTYTNSCFAEGAGAQILHDGECMGDEDPNDGFQNEFLQGIVETMEPSAFCKIYPDFEVCR